MYKIITSANAVGALVALSFLVHFLHKKEYSKFYHFYIILQCSGLALLLSTSIYMFYKTDDSWVMRLFGLVYWTKTFVFIHSMKVHFEDTEGSTGVALKLSDENKRMAKQLADHNAEVALKLSNDSKAVALHLADDQTLEAKRVADDNTEKALQLSDENTREAKEVADHRFDEAQHAADDRFDEAKKKADDRYDNKP